MSSSIQPHVLREYALVADGERGALIGPDGVIAWLCAPRWDSPPPSAGYSAARAGMRSPPSDPWNAWGGYYETGSLIWRSRWGGGSAHAQQRKHRGVSRVAVVGLSDLRIAGLWRRGE